MGIASLAAKFSGADSNFFMKVAWERKEDWVNPGGEGRNDNGILSQINVKKVLFCST